MIHFAWPWVLAALPLPLLVHWLVPRANRQETALKVPAIDTFRVDVNNENTERLFNKNIVVNIVFSIIWLLLILSAAKPEHRGEPISITTNGRDLMMAIDISVSMGTADMIVGNQRFTRDSVVKFIASEFLAKREGDQVGLILFGGNAYLQAPLTFDLSTVSKFLNEAESGLGGEGTAIGDAIGLAVKRLSGRPESQRVVILLTDGENERGIDPRLAANNAAIAGVKIHTIGVGAERSFGMFRASRPDEATLRYIAETTGGRYFRARDPQELQSIYAELDQIEIIDQEARQITPVKSFYHYPLALALLLTLFIGGGFCIQRYRQKNERSL